MDRFAARPLSRRQLMVAAGGMGLGLLVECGRLPGQAHAPATSWRLGFLAPGAADQPDATPQWAALWAELRDLGYVEGETLVVESRFADGQQERLPALAGELVQLGVDLIVAASS